MSLPPALRSLLLNGPGSSHYDPLRYGGSAVIHAAWGRHKAELIAACKPGTRPWAFWRIQLGIQKPAGEAGQLRIIKKLELYRDDAEKAYVLERLKEITAGIRAARELPRSAPHVRAIESEIRLSLLVGPHRLK